MNDWKFETSTPVKIFSLITEETKSVNINTNVRSLERLAGHITQTIGEFGNKAGLVSDQPEGKSLPPTMGEIIASYQE